MKWNAFWRRNQKLPAVDRENAESALTGLVPMSRLLERDTVELKNAFMMFIKHL